ncbi:PD-(D/E)XK nuclease family protein [Xanthobacter tagetidis]|uniref:PD-(D/E)XK nuclease family protein n=1 Tax=Xanthobacter tagetidis TaxID=60216 RepID=A0A3L7AMD9_9HYPH|nr:PD-(D/E)XK nuclease family protein [Xanthobacter tagetidis]RLP81125.1 hypothetical protein D9R14_03795 [Xanthobacter tagetidis]
MHPAVSSLAPMLVQLDRRRPAIDAERLASQLYGAPDFSPMRLFNPGEATLSRVIAELFDPSGAHGQGPLFLNAFLGVLGLPTLGQFDWCRIRTEVPVRRMETVGGDRRIDIVIETPDLVIGIENKPWAPQSERQLSEYWSALTGRLDGKIKKLAFISQQEAATAQESVSRVPYVASDGRSLYAIFDGVLDKIKAIPVRAFVVDLLSYFAAQFGDKPLMKEDDSPFLNAVDEIISKNENARKAAFIVLLAGRRLHKSSIDEIEAFLTADLQAMGLHVCAPYSLHECLSVQYRPWSLRRDTWPERCVLALEAQRSHFEQILVGVRAPDPKLGARANGQDCTDHDRLRNVRDKVGGGSRSQWWPCYQLATPRDWSQEEIARLVLEEPGPIVAHRDIQRLRDYLVSLASAIDECIEIAGAP